MLPGFEFSPVSGDAPDLRRKALDVFAEIVALEPAARADALHRLGQSDPALHARVIRLVEADAQAEQSSYLGGNASSIMTGDHAPPPAALLAEGDEVGSYRLEKPLGVGGMGEVWLSRRRDGVTDAPVALKLMHPHLAHSTLRERFLREGRILGGLAHPHVARLLDAGISGDGRLFLAIEYVEGQPIDAWCDERRLGLEARLHLFLEVCEAVAHAHAHLVVHRDLKPSNILVSPDGGIKLLDFGIAKLIEDTSSVGNATELTRIGGRVLTPEYAAPEQIGGGSITTATDVYSLGVLFYLLLSGRHPYGHPGQPVAQVERQVLETEPPPPSRTRVLDTRTLPAGLAASLRDTTPPALRRALRGDLDTIVLKALKKLPQDRYATVLALADDVQRHLDGMPVLAQPDSFAYRTRKFVRRHRGAMSTAAVASLAIVIGLGAALYEAWRAEGAAHRADAEARKATAVKEFLVGIFEKNSEEDPDGAAARNVTAGQLLDQGAQRIRDELKDTPAVRAELLGTIGRLYAGMLLDDQAIALLQEQVTTLRRIHGERPDGEIAGALVALGQALSDAGRFEESDRALGSGLAMLDALHEDTSMTRVLALNSRGHNAYLNRPTEDGSARRDEDEALRILEDHHPEDARRVAVLLELSRIADREGDAAVAEQRVREAVAFAESRPVSETRMMLPGAYQEYGNLLVDQLRPQEADTMLHKALALLTASAGADSVWSIQVRADLCRVLDLQGGLAESQQCLAGVVADFERQRGPDDAVYVADARLDLGFLQIARGQFAEGVDAISRSLAAYRAQTPDASGMLDALAGRADGYIAMGRLQDAARDLAELRAKALPQRGEDDAYIATVVAREGELQVEKGEIDAAEASFRQVLERWPPQHDRMTVPESTAVTGSLQVLLARGEPEEAVRRGQEFLDRLARIPQVAAREQKEARVRLWLGEALRESGRTRDAESQLRRAVQLREQLDDPSSPWLAQARALLAECLIDERESAQAKPLLDAAAKADSAQVVADSLTVALHHAQARLKGA